ncbi:MAG: hypothetical protein AD742_06330 [Methylibium sp. NZG]|nr:MAG: hypothetical protein AD742_06330 [Methylibium sp. NZG]
MELIVSITLLSTMALVAVPMLRIPMTAYLEASARAGATTELDTVQARLGADLARALPNSVRVRTVGSRQLLEFLEVRAEGRHRSGPSGGPQSCPAVCNLSANHDSLEAACTERCFMSLGALRGDAPVPGSDYVVVNPLGPGVPSGDPYAGGAGPVVGGIKSRLTATAAVSGSTRMSIAPHSFPALAGTRRFYVVSGPVSYECDPTTQLLQRHDGYAIGALQPAAFGGAQTAPLAVGVTACRFSYTATGARGGMVNLWLRMTRPVSAGAPPEFSELVLMAPVTEGG